MRPLEALGTKRPLLAMGLDTLRPKNKGFQLKQKLLYFDKVSRVNFLSSSHDDCCGGPHLHVYDHRFADDLSRHFGSLLFDFGSLDWAVPVLARFVLNVFGALRLLGKGAATVFFAAESSIGSPRQLFIFDHTQISSAHFPVDR